MKKSIESMSLFFLLLLGSCPNLKAQVNQDLKSTNLFEYGKPTTSIEANFENLFRNFPRFVENANEMDLVNYKYIGSIKNTRQAIKYLSQNIHPGAPGWGYSSIHGGSDSVSRTIIAFNDKIKENKEQCRKIVETISNAYIHEGYKVYEITYVLDLVKHEYYVFADPKTNEVVKKGNLFAVKIFPYRE